MRLRSLSGYSFDRASLVEPRSPNKSLSRKGLNWMFPLREMIDLMRQKSNNGTLQDLCYSQFWHKLSDFVAFAN